MGPRTWPKTTLALRRRRSSQRDQSRHRSIAGWPSTSSLTPLDDTQRAQLHGLLRLLADGVNLCPSGDDIACAELLSSLPEHR
jgi:hypothetical protein